jgi:threonylcarbamoyladenosine tRNA methylthiotransferase MtaB
VEKRGAARAEDFTELTIDGGEAGQILPLRVTGHDGRRARAQAMDA